ncbi:MAG: methyltransferase domain-containing protein [Verrucomicrobiales bacterium]|nr:methyltransferase domain-containing protein [Verrucomicrobiales bacterium]
MYQEGTTPWDKGKSHPALAEIFEKTSLPAPVLVPGCGFGHDLKTIADQGVAEVIGLDIAPSAVEEARRRHADTTAISVIHGDLFSPPTTWRGHFGAVWEHTCFCAIDPSQRSSYAKSIAEALRPSGLLAGVFYLTPWDPDEDQTQGPPFGTSTAELDSIFLPWFHLEAEWVPTATYQGREQRELIRLLRRRTFPV